jgi:KaiC/GvpD/RAD55 family RecA-like ATPase
MTQSVPIPGSDEPETISTGSSGLDDILGGGFDADRVYLIEGRPGTGKTTLALQFLLEGVRRGEPSLYVTLSESEGELRSVVTRHGFSLTIGEHGLRFQSPSRITPFELRMIAVAVPRQMKAYAATGAPTQLQYRQNIPTEPRV